MRVYGCGVDFGGGDVCGGDVWAIWVGAAGGEGCGGGIFGGLRVSGVFNGLPACAADGGNAVEPDHFPKSRRSHSAGLYAAKPACLPRHGAADWRHQRAVQAEPVRLRRGRIGGIIHLVFGARLWRTAAAAAVCQSRNLGNFRGGDWAADVEHCLPYLVSTVGSLVRTSIFLL